MRALPNTDLAHIWQHARPLLSELAEARVFITGGTGFFGIWLLESIAYLAKVKGIYINTLVLSRDPFLFLSKAPHLKNVPSIQFCQGDVCTFDFPKVPITHIIHAATPSNLKFNTEQPKILFNMITNGTKRVLDFAEQINAKKMLFVSSCAVYGEQPATLSHIPESCLSAPDSLLSSSAYGLGKRVAEHWCILYAKESALQVKIARCFAFVGPYLPLDTHFAIGNFIKNVLDQEPIQVKSDGLSCRSYLYAADLIIWLWTILCQGQANVAYNVGSDEAITIRELAAKVSTLSSLLHVGKALPVIVNHSTEYASFAQHRCSVPNIRLAQETLGLSVRVSLDAAILATLMWNQSCAKT